jgi:hypothetical protein
MINAERSHGGTDLDAGPTYRAYLEVELREMAPPRDGRCLPGG